MIPANTYDTFSVVPDVAFLATFIDLPRDERQYPNVPPDILVEVRSPDDDVNDITKKHDFYLSWGVKLVIIADPQGRTVEAKEQNEPVAYFDGEQTITSKSFPSLALPLRSIFADLDGLD